MNTIIIESKNYDNIKNNVNPFIFSRLCQDPNVICIAAENNKVIKGLCIFEVTDEVTSVLEMDTFGITEEKQILHCKKNMLTALIELLKETSCEILSVNAYEANYDGLEVLLKDMEFMLYEERYDIKFRLEDAAKALLGHGVKDASHVFAMDQLDNRVLVNYNNYLVENDLYYNMWSADVDKSLSSFYTSEGKEDEIEACLLISKDEDDKSLNIDYLRADLNAANGIALYAMLSQSIKKALELYSGSTLIRAYIANDHMQEIFDKLAIKNAKSLRIATYLLNLS